MKVKDYKELRVWKKGIEIVDRIYSLTSKFPQSESYALSNQMRKAAVSISSNIAEGFMRRGTGEYRQFLHVSLGSCAELETQIIISSKRQYLSNVEMEDSLEDINYEIRMLISMIQKISNSRVTSHLSRVTENRI